MSTTDIYTLSLHDALPILLTPGFRKCFLSMDESKFQRFPVDAKEAKNWAAEGGKRLACSPATSCRCRLPSSLDRKSTRLNSSHQIISYAVFCLKKKISIK